MSSNQINYKQKYQELKLKYMESVDAAFRLGYEQGAQQAAQDQMAMQQQQQAEMQQQQQAGGPDFSGHGAEGSPAGAEQQANPNQGSTIDSENPAGSELDQHIAKLESMLKGEVKAEDLKKTLDGFKAVQAKIQLAGEMKKSTAAIAGIAKALHKPEFKIGKVASHNMNDSAKRAVSMQHDIVSNIMKSWDEEEKKTGKDINAILNIEGLIKKEEK